MENDKGLIFKKMVSIMRKIEPITKTSTNTQQGYKFRSIDAFYNKLHDILAEEGVVVSVNTKLAKREERPNKRGDGLIFTTLLDAVVRFYAEDGSFFETTITGEGMDSGDKATNKAVSAAVKYALATTWLVPTQESIAVDGDKDSPEPGLSDAEAGADKIKKEFDGTDVTPEAPALTTILATIDNAKTIETLNTIRDKLAKYTFTKATKAAIDAAINTAVDTLAGGNK